MYARMHAGIPLRVSLAANTVPLLSIDKAIRNTPTPLQIGWNERRIRRHVWVLWLLYASPKH